MTLEEQLYSRLQNGPLNPLLVKYNGVPAIFERQAPPDNDTGWGKGPQYPRIDYTVDRQEDPARRVAGVVAFNIWCLASGEVRPEDLEPQLRADIDGVVFHPRNESVTALKWSRSDIFDAGEGDNLVIGYTVTFNLLAFPVQATFEPDPVTALNVWTKTISNNLQVDPDTWSPTDENPAVYWRISGAKIDRMESAVTWHEVNLVAHILAPNPEKRLLWARTLTEKIGSTRRLKMSDGGPLELLGGSYDSQADPFQRGQVQLRARYGILLDRSQG